MEKTEKVMYPNFEVIVGSPQIQVQLTEYQVDLLLSILQNNINAPYAQLHEQYESQESKPPQQLYEESLITPEQRAELEEKDKNKKIDIKVEVNIKKIIADLYIGDGSDLNAKLCNFEEVEIHKLLKHCSNDPQETAACKLLSGNCLSLKTDVYLYSNNTMDCGLTIENFNMIDSRLNRDQNLFPTVFSTTHTSPDNPGFSLTYQQKIGSLQECKILVNRPNLISVPDIYVDTLIYILPFSDKIIYSIDIFNHFWGIFSKKLEGISVTSAQQKVFPPFPISPSLSPFPSFPF